MSSSKLTMIGLYEYDNTLFDNLSLPEGLDKDTLIDNILLRSGEFEVIYPDTDFMKFSIGAWSRKWSPTITRWVTALAIEYNPLENYDRYEHWTDERDISGSSSGSESGSDSGSSSGAETGSSSGTTGGTTGSTTTNKVSAYDAGNALTTHDQSETNGSDSTTNSGNYGKELSDTHSNEFSNEHSDEHSADDDLEHDGRIHGNIGVTTSQQMLLSELDLGYWNIYEKITDLFLTEFVIPIY